MSNNEAFSVIGLFEKPEEIYHAAEETVEKGYSEFDVYTPYPVHGMDGAMGLEPSKIGYLTFMFGLTGITVLTSFVAWIVTTNNVDIFGLVGYPSTYAGKQDFSLPGYIPIMFEATVFWAGHLSVLSLILFFLGFPRNYHPLHDTEFMKRVSDDKFGLSIEASDPKFSEEEVTAFMKSLDAQDVQTVYLKPEDETSLHLFHPGFLVFLGGTAVTVSAAIYLILNWVVWTLPFNWMHFQDRQVAQEAPRFFKDGYSMRNPVEGTVARGFIPAAFAADKADKSDKYLLNPLPVNKKVLERGQVAYDSNCAACHGPFGLSNNYLTEAYAKPPSLQSDKIVEWSDGQIYHVIVNGQNRMPSYAKQVSRDDRWALVHYIRAMQRSLNPKDADLQP